jgi:hypothetical protein
LRIVTIKKPGRPKSRSSIFSPAILRSPPPRGEGEQQDRAIADRDRRRRRPLELERCRQPLCGDGGAAVVAAGVCAPGAFEQIAHDPLVGRRRQPGLPMKESDRRGPRAQGLGRGAAVSQVAQEGRDQRGVRAQGLEAQALGVGGELPPAGLVGPAGVFGGGAGDEFAGGGDGAGDVWGGGGRNVDHAGSHSSGGRASPVVLIKPLLSTPQQTREIICSGVMKFGEGPWPTHFKTKGPTVHQDLTRREMLDHVKAELEGMQSAEEVQAQEE